MATLLGQHAHSRGLPYPIGQCGVEELDEVVAHIVPHPLVEEGAKEIAPLSGRDREVCQHALLLHTRGQGQAVGACLHTFDNGRELDVVAAYLLEEAVEAERVVGIEAVDYGQRIPFHPVAVEQLYAAHHLGEAGTA